MRVAILGTGYVGLVTGAGLAETGATVVCVDVDADRVSALQRGEMPLYEPGLAELVARNAAAGRLAFTTDPARLAGVAVAIVAVGTPTLSDGTADLAAVDAAADAVARHAGDAVLVVKSTVPAGTAQRLAARFPRLSVVANPEFLREGEAVADFLHPHRIVAGCVSEAARPVVASLYAPLVPAERIVWMDPASAELTKYAANAMLAVRVSFINEVAALCERVGADVGAVRRGIGSDPRIGEAYLEAGAGYGGACLPKDVPALVGQARAHGLEMAVAGAADRVNRRQRHLLAEHVAAAVGTLDGARVAVWGLSFKPGTDDVRESPALVLVDDLLAAGAVVVAHDPAAMPRVAARYGERLILLPDPWAAAEGADALVLATAWPEYLHPDFDRLRAVMRRPALVDGRNAWRVHDPAGFQYLGIG